MRKTKPFLSLLLLASFLTATRARAQQCPWGVFLSPKKSALYLYFPTVQDSTFPAYGSPNGPEPTSPVNPFDMAQHDPGISTADVRQRTLELMRDAWCEFDVSVKMTTTTPAPAEPRWQIIGIGSDVNSVSGLTGLAQLEDLGDNIAQDYARIWTKELHTFAGAKLTGANSTVERWATALTNIAAHEASHNYGGFHWDSAPAQGSAEDASPNHFIADPKDWGATPSTITDRLNHHSDTLYERFGHDLGLAIQTLHNWDFVNPNATDADNMFIRVLSKAPALTIGWSYDGLLSPWTNPTVTKLAQTTTFQGEAYNVFDVVFSSPKGWNGGPNGVVPAGEKFHVGVTFQEKEDVIVFETNLRKGNLYLKLAPRMFGYDAGTAAGAFQFKFYNPGATDLLLSDVQVLFLPRMVDIEEMVVGGALRGIGGHNVTPFARRPRDGNDGISDRFEGPVRVGREPLVVPVAKLTDTRHLDRVIRRGECEGNAAFGGENDQSCPTPGHVLSLFPATYTYVMATVTDPQAHYWNKELQRYVDGPLSTQFFFQIAGEVPDANANGVDDLIDIREGTSRDANGNGVDDLIDIREGTSRDANGNGIPDEAEFSRRTTSQTTALGLFNNLFRPWPLAGSVLH